MVLELRGKTVLIIGLGMSGRSAARFLLKEGSCVWGVDDKWPALQNSLDIQTLRFQGLMCVGSCEAFEKMVHGDFDLVIVSPGIPRSHPLYVLACQKSICIMGEIELALQYFAKMKCKCIGVTGTNGKTTVNFLLEHVFNANGIAAKAVGNSGIPLTSLLCEENDAIPEIVAIELSSFQLETLQTPVLDAAILLNITPDHLDRYASMQEYAQAKARIFACVKSSGFSYVEEKCLSSFKDILAIYNLRTYGYSSSCDLYSDFQQLIRNGSNECGIPPEYQGKVSHDLENMIAVYGVAKEFGLSSKGIMDGMLSFRKPPHRLEFVREVNGVVFIDDSKATNVDAVVRAVESVQTPIILIAGGVDKGGSYASWLLPFANRVRAICTIGLAAEKIKKELQENYPIYNFKTFHDAVMYAAELANPSETVLLSPGCSSFDMFSSYAHRGETFKTIINNLTFKEKS